MKHVLLTGAVQIGKSTALKRFLVKHGYCADGYRTYWKDKDTLYIAPFDGSEGVCAAVTEKGVRRALPEGFEYGASLIENSGKKQLIVFDELGRLEQCSDRFMNAVFEKLKGEKPVVGVIKKEKNPFLDKIRENPNVIILEVTEDNRNRIPEEIEKYIIIEKPPY